MKRKVMLLTAAFALILTAFLVAFPFIEIDTGKRLIICSYSGDFSVYEKNQSYNELYCYNEKYDVSIKNFEVKNFLFFYTINMDYIKGDFRKTQFVLPQSYIQNFLQNAEIIENEKNIQISSLIEGKTAIEGNKRYTGNDYDNALFYKLDGKYEEMYVFYSDDLLVIQVGSPDELPKYIAYK
ncbi:MAG: hypothetical protein E7562_07875 [Ruminococcaceae bacterium]|nr:hypothetical protein [Oscillospiraceae bacterium]